MINGKAFEYACLQAVLRAMKALNKETDITIDAAYETAKNAYFSLKTDRERDRLTRAADTAARLLMPLEPRLANGKGALQLSVAADSIAIGADGDVRDVFCIRSADGWAIGMSCKHNHEALRHPRITEAKDFGKDWLSIPCSKEYMDEITPITDALVAHGQNKDLWRNIPNKWDSFYVPILKAYKNEIIRLCNTYPDAPERLLSYFFGSNDFYKVIMMARSRTTTIEGFNIHGTLNKPCGKIKAMTKVPVIKMPDRLIDADFKEKSKTTIILTFDHGWAVSMRLHNKDSIARPTSLAWDVQLVGVPPQTYKNTHSWDE